MKNSTQLIFYFIFACPAIISFICAPGETVFFVGNAATGCLLIGFVIWTFYLIKAAVNYRRDKNSRGK